MVKLGLDVQGHPEVQTGSKKLSQSEVYAG